MTNFSNNDDLDTFFNQIHSLKIGKKESPFVESHYQIKELKEIEHKLQTELSQQDISADEIKKSVREAQQKHLINEAYKNLAIFSVKSNNLNNFINENNKKIKIIGKKLNSGKKLNQDELLLQEQFNNIRKEESWSRTMVLATEKTIEKYKFEIINSHTNQSFNKKINNTYGFKLNEDFINNATLSDMKQFFKTDQKQYIRPLVKQPHIKHKKPPKKRSGSDSNTNTKQRLFRIKEKGEIAKKEETPERGNSPLKPAIKKPPIKSNIEPFKSTSQKEALFRDVMLDPLEFSNIIEAENTSISEMLSTIRKEREAYLERIGTSISKIEELKKQSGNNKEILDKLNSMQNLSQDLIAGNKLPAYRANKNLPESLPESPFYQAFGLTPGTSYEEIFERISKMKEEGNIVQDEPNDIYKQIQENDVDVLLILMKYSSDLQNFRPIETMEKRLAESQNQLKSIKEKEMLNMLDNKISEKTYNLTALNALVDVIENLKKQTLDPNLYTLSFSKALDDSSKKLSSNQITSLKELLNNLTDKEKETIGITTAEINKSLNTQGRKNEPPIKTSIPITNKGQALNSLNSIFSKLENLEKLIKNASISPADLKLSSKNIENEINKLKKSVVYRKNKSDRVFINVAQAEYALLKLQKNIATLERATNPISKPDRRVGLMSFLSKKSSKQDSRHQPLVANTDDNKPPKAPTRRKK